MKNTDYLVSIIIPTYNRVELLLNCVESILRQSYNNLEVLIIDDGSTDDSERRVGSIDERIIYHKMNKSGDVSILRNFGIKVSKGEYIAFCDDDDCWDENKLQVQMGHTDRYNVICSNAEFIDSKGKAAEGIYCTDFESDTPLNTVHLFIRNYVITSSVLLKREILPSVPFDSKKFKSTAEDYDLWMRLSLKYPIFYINKPLVKYRVHSNLTYSYNNLPVIYENGINIIRKYKNEVPAKSKKFADWGIFKLRKDYIKLNISRSKYLPALSQLLRILPSFFRFGFLLLFFTRFFITRKNFLKNIEINVTAENNKINV